MQNTLANPESKSAAFKQKPSAPGSEPKTFWVHPRARSVFGQKISTCRDADKNNTPPVAFSISIDHWLNFLVDLVFVSLVREISFKRQPTRKSNTMLTHTKVPSSGHAGEKYKKRIKKKWRGMLPRVTYCISFALLKERQKWKLLSQNIVNLQHTAVSRRRPICKLYIYCVRNN